MKIIFFGTSDFAVPVLEILIKSRHKIAAVITQPDKPIGRKQIITPPPVKIVAKKFNLQVFQPRNLKIETLKSLPEMRNFKFNADIGIVASYGKIIPKWLLSLPKFGLLNIHPSLLPKYRGPTPIQTAILNGDTTTGVTIMIVDEEMDHGPVLASRKLEILDSDFKTLSSGLSRLGGILLVEILPKYISGGIRPTEQDHSKATFTKIFSRTDGKIDWGRSPEKIYNQIRALNPEPGTWSMWQNKVINIKSAQLINGQVKIKTIQAAGKKETSFADFLRGHPKFDIAELN